MFLTRIANLGCAKKKRCELGKVDIAMGKDFFSGFQLAMHSVDLYLVFLDKRSLTIDSRWIPLDSICNYYDYGWCMICIYIYITTIIYIHIYIYTSYHG